MTRRTFSSSDMRFDCVCSRPAVSTIDDVPPARSTCLDGVVCDRGRIGTARRSDEVGSRALRPDLELLLGRGAKRVRRAHEHRPPVLA